jgi:hypothetical protein
MKTLSPLWIVPMLAFGCQAETHPTEVAIQTGALTSSQGTAPTVSLGSLPSPRVRLSAAKVWAEPAQQARAKEAENFLLHGRYAGFRIMDTVQTSHGTIIDYVDATSVGKVATNPPPVPTNAADIDRAATAEIDESPSLHGPAGSIPFVRPDFGRYISGESGHESVGSFVKNLVHGRTDGQIRLYGGYRFLMQNGGAFGTVTAFAADPVESGTFTLMEMAAGCPTLNTSEIVGVMFSRDLANFSDQQLRLHVEFYSANGGGFDDFSGGFVPYSQRTFAPGVVFSPSTVVGSGLHYETAFQLQVFQGNWWVWAGGTWLGYYPGNLFTMGLNTAGCRIGWYGEVFDPSPASWTHDSMGNGTWASAGWNGYAAYWRNFAYYDIYQNTWFYPDPISPLLQQTPTAVDPNCYTTSQVSDVTSPPYPSPALYPIFYLGGPGGKNAACH